MTSTSSTVDTPKREKYGRNSKLRPAAKRWSWSVSTTMASTGVEAVMVTRVAAGAETNCAA
jgi:hypothetical protein